MERLPSFLQVKMSRRALLRTTALGAVGVVAGACGEQNEEAAPRKPSLALPENPDGLQRYVEDKYKVHLRTFRDNALEFGAPSKDFPDTSLEKWDGERIKLIAEILDILPEHFHRLGNNGEKLRVTLLTGSHGTCCGWWETQGYPHQVALSTLRFDPKNPRKALMHFVHESAHLMDPFGAIPVDIVRDKESKGEDLTPLSSWWVEVEQITGGLFGVEGRRDGVYADVLSRNDALLRKYGLIEWGENVGGQDLKPKDKDKVLVSEAMVYGFSGFDPSEFIPAMAEIYLFGKKVFVEQYSTVFSEDVAEKLYEFTMVKVFSGREFKSFPIERQDEYLIFGTSNSLP